MIPLAPPYRIATEQDAGALADLVNFAGAGLPLYLWQGMAGPDEDPWSVGRARQAEKARAGQIVVADPGPGPVAALTGYAIGSKPVRIGPDFPAMFRPLQELENAAPGSWYVNVLASYPEHRGKGFGAALLRIAERIAASEGITRMSLIVADSNAAARRFYDRQGYMDVARRPCVREGWDTDTTEWLLLIKPL